MGVADRGVVCNKMEAVIFDVGGVLVTSPVGVIQEYERELCLPRFTIGSSFVKGGAFFRLERGEIHLRQFCDEFQAECRLNASQRGIVLPSQFSVMELISRFDEAKPVPETIHALQQLKSLGVKTCIITNDWIDDMHPSYPDHPFLQYVDVLIQSSRVGIRKPDLRIYDMACSQLDVDPTQVVFLDDLGVNLKTARAMGITTILVREGQFTAAVRQLEQVMNMEGLLTLNTVSKL